MVDDRTDDEVTADDAVAAAAADTPVHPDDADVAAEAVAADAADAATVAELTLRR